MADPNESGAGKVKFTKIDEETALLEINKFLDLKRVSDRKRVDTFEQQIKDLTGLMMDGRFTFDFERKRATFKLNAPLKAASGAIETLELRFYIGMQEVQNVLKNIGPSEVDARSMALAAALSGNNANAFRNSENAVGEKGLDISDHNALYAYTLFFLA